MPQPFDYRVGVPDIGPALSDLVSTVEQVRERKLSEKIGGLAAAGDLAGASGEAYRAGKLDTGASFANMNAEQQQRVAQTIGNWARGVKTPEEWQKGIATLEKRFGRPMPEYHDFANRDVLVAEVTDPFKEAELGLKIAKEQREQNESDRKAPETVKGFDEQGREQLYQWDAGQRRLVPVGGAKAPSKGTRLSVGPNGEVTFEQGGAELGTSATNTVQGKAINMAEMGSRTASIMESFKPEFLTLGSKFANLWRSGVAKVDPKALDPGDRAALSDFAKFRSESIGNLNRLMNELSGAAVSPAEAERLKAEVPSPGTGLFDGDDPVTFQAKAERVMESVNKALARYKFYQMQGLPDSLDSIPLNNVRQIDGEWFVIRDGKVFRVGSVNPAKVQ